MPRLPVNQVRGGTLEDAPLNKLPSGLLDFFGIKSFGQYPQLLDTKLQPAIDLWNHYVAANAEDYVLATAGLTGGVNNGYIPVTGITGSGDAAGAPYLVGGIWTVPNNELWYVQLASTYAQIGPDAAGANNTFKTGIGAATNGFSLQLATLFTGWDTGHTSPARSHVSSLASPIFLPPGSTFFPTNHGNFTTIIVTVSLRARIVRMRV